MTWIFTDRQHIMWSRRLSYYCNDAVLLALMYQRETLTILKLYVFSGLLNLLTCRHSKMKRFGFLIVLVIAISSDKHISLWNAYAECRDQACFCSSDNLEYHYSLNTHQYCNLRLIMVTSDRQPKWPKDKALSQCLYLEVVSKHQIISSSMTWIFTRPTAYKVAHS